MNIEGVVQESLISKMQPTWTRSDDKRLSSLLTAEHRNLYPDHPKGKPFKVVFFSDEKHVFAMYYANIEDAHSAMYSWTN